MLYCRCYKKRW